MHNKKRFLTVSLSVILSFAFIFISCSKDNNYGTNPGTGGGGNAGANEVLIANNTFNPGAKTISVGTTVKWINKDAATHTVTSGTRSNPSGVFDSGNLGQNGEFSYTFNTAGTFQYFCKIHNGMAGTITVQ